MKCACDDCSFRTMGESDERIRDYRNLIGNLKSVITGQRAALNSMQTGIRRRDAKLRKAREALRTIMDLGTMSATEMANRFSEVVKVMRKSKEIYEGQFEGEE